jgi:hypothetical protein
MIYEEFYLFFYKAKISWKELQDLDIVLIHLQLF